MHSWSFPIFLTLALVLVALVYLRGWYRLRRDLPRALSGWRLASFSSGVCLLWAATGSPLAMLDHQLLTFHMAQHLLLMTVVAPLILLGAPVITMLYGLPVRLVRFGAVSAVGRVAAHPVFCWLAASGVVMGWHVPMLFEFGMHSERWHSVEQASFLVAGLLFWWPVVQPWPSVARWPRWLIPVYLFLATLPCDALSAFLTFCGRVVYPHYLSAHRVFELSPLADQEFAGAMMWVVVTFAYLAPAAFVTIQLLSPPKRMSQRRQAFPPANPIREE